MAEAFKVVYYVNQFFGQIGGEDKASIPVDIRDEEVGLVQQFGLFLGGVGKVTRTIICGDNYFNENKEKALAEILSAVKEADPQIFVAGPSFNAGRYGVACAEIAKAVANTLNIPVVSGMYHENPGLNICREFAYVVSTGDSAAGMKAALPIMADITKKLAAGEDMVSPQEAGYFPRGMRKTLFVEQRGSKRAIEMLKAVLKNEDFETEMPMPVFDNVIPAEAIKELSKATIALCTSGGIVPRGNPDRIESASAQKWAKYDISDRHSLSNCTADKTESDGSFYSTHGGYDPVYANQMPDRIAPLDILNELKSDGYIGDVYRFFFTTTGTGTAVSKAAQFGEEIGALLKEEGVDGVILTST